MYQITRKTFLARNLKRLQKLFPLEYDFIPKTWVLPNELNDLKYYALQPTNPHSKPSKRKEKLTTTQKLDNFERAIGHLHSPR